jgi:WD40 repeat protein
MVMAVAVTAGGDRAVSASDDRTVRIWDLASGRPLHTLTGHADWVTAVAVTAGGDRAVSASTDGTVRVWDCRNGSLLVTAPLEGMPRCVTWAPDHKTVIAGDGIGNVYGLLYVESRYLCIAPARSQLLPRSKT